MKQVLFLFAVVFLIAGCGETNQFASINDETTSQQAASQIPDKIEELQSIAQVDVQPKIGGKGRQDVDVLDSIGGNNLNETLEEAPSAVSVEVSEEPAPEPTPEPEPAPESEPAPEPEPRPEPVKRVEVEVQLDESPALKKVDLLFYLEDLEGECSERLSKYAFDNGFLSHIHSVDWRVAFSYYFDNGEVNLIPIQYKNGSAFNQHRSLWRHKSAYQMSYRDVPSSRLIDRFFAETLRSAEPRSDDKNPANPYKVPSPHLHVYNPLQGLDQLLSEKPKGVIREDSHVIVVLFGDEFPYYKSRDWTHFLRKHPNVDIVTVAPRSANVSNLVHILNYRKFTFVSSCGRQETFEDLLKVMQKKVN